MKFESINSDSTLYAVSQIFPDDIVEKLDTVDWASLPSNKFDSDRLNLIMPLHLLTSLSYYFYNTINPAIESAAKIKFLNPENFSISVWLNEPGYQSNIHIDGSLPATMQIYWRPTDRSDCGTWFYNTRDENDILHYFANTKNTGYLSFPQIASQPLWHGTKGKLEPGIFRLCFMITYSDIQSQR